MDRLSAVIIAQDEREMIARAVASCAFADEVLVVDGGSTDGTQQIAEHAGARVVERPFDDFARQRNFSLEQATGEWVLFVDADERVTPALAEEVRALVGSTTAHDVYRIPRRAMALGRWLDWHFDGGPDAPVRLVRRTGARWDGPVHEVANGAGEPGMLRASLIHLTHRSVSEVVRKIDRYASLEAEELIARGARAPSARTILGSFPKAAWRLWRSGLRRNGVEGAIETVLLAFNRTLVLAKVWERTRAAGIAEAYEAAEREVTSPVREDA